MCYFVCRNRDIFSFTLVNEFFVWLPFSWNFSRNHNVGSKSNFTISCDTDVQGGRNREGKLFRETLYLHAGSLCDLEIRIASNSRCERYASYIARVCLIAWDHENVWMCKKKRVLYSLLCEVDKVLSLHFWEWRPNINSNDICMHMLVA